MNVSYGNANPRSKSAVAPKSRKAVGQVVPAFGTPGVDGEADGLGETDGLGDGLVPGVADGDGLGVTEADGLGETDGLGDGLVPGVTVGVGLGEAVAIVNVNEVRHSGTGLPSTARGLETGALGATGPSCLSLIAVNTARTPKPILIRAINKNGQFFFNIFIFLPPCTLISRI